MTSGKKNPDLTVCQVHRAQAALVQSWWLPQAARKPLREQAAKEIAHWQRKNRTARECHTRTTWRKLQRLGITERNLVRCPWYDLAL